MSECFAFGLAANRADLGSLASCIVPIVSECFAFGLAANRAGLGSVAGRIVPIMSERFNENLAAFGTNLIGRTACRRTASVTGNDNREIDVCGVKVYGIRGSKSCGYSVALNRGKLNIGDPFPTLGKRDIKRAVFDADGKSCGHYVIGSLVAGCEIVGYLNRFGCRLVEIGLRCGRGDCSLAHSRCGQHVPVNAQVLIGRGIGYRACVSACDKLNLIHDGGRLDRGRNGEVLCTFVNGNCKIL